MLLLLWAACHPLPPDWTWAAAPRCGLPEPDRLACEAAGGEVARPLVCSGVPLPEPTPAEVRAEERAYRRGEAHCACITDRDQQDCARTP